MQGMRGDRNQVQKLAAGWVQGRWLLGPLAGVRGRTSGEGPMGGLNDGLKEERGVIAEPVCGKMSNADVAEMEGGGNR